MEWQLINIVSIDFCRIKYLKRDPLCQPNYFVILMRKIKQVGLKLVVFLSGYTPLPMPSQQIAFSLHRYRTMVLPS